ncbi:DUF2807 domain-containing protein [Hymenobacter aerilatus]|uniref:DUF2807 domain-containing protein n=1 Tax=Hymenobacter aerilatus TaxID=2932251 RepID=A0A8T9SUV0_9BACT|nr:head GIN domain-containing protein [Hymenobacter aerilatus]UOR04503.1 DUF2807 domain-containing protein [Hymenobacter aerilatus]
MKTLIGFCLFVCALFFSQSVLADTRETRQVGAFSEIGLGGSANVILRQGSPQKVEVEGSTEDVARLETIVEGKRLRIRRKPESNFRGRDYQGKITVYITMPDINALAVSGSGSIKALTDVQSHVLALSVSGSGNIELPEMQADKTDISISGSGNVNVAGVSTDTNVSISGSGSIQATKLRAETCGVRIAGSGNARVYASKTLDARIAGSGSVYVSGNPQVSSSVAGSGRVHRS